MLEQGSGELLCLLTSLGPQFARFLDGAQVCGEVATSNVDHGDHVLEPEGYGPQLGAIINRAIQSVGLLADPRILFDRWPSYVHVSVEPAVPEQHVHRLIFVGPGWA